MPQSPHRNEVYVPTYDVEAFRSNLERQRIDYEVSINNEYAEKDLIDLGSELHDHCEFLKGNLKVKVGPSFAPSQRHSRQTHGSWWALFSVPR